MGLRDPKKIKADKTVTSFCLWLIKEGETYRQFAWDGDRYIINLKNGDTYHVDEKGWELQAK